MKKLISDEENKIYVGFVYENEDGKIGICCGYQDNKNGREWFGVPFYREGREWTSKEIPKFQAMSAYDYMVGLRVLQEKF